MGGKRRRDGEGGPIQLDCGQRTSLAQQSECDQIVPSTGQASEAVEAIQDREDQMLFWLVIFSPFFFNHNFTFFIILFKLFYNKL
jgi:hypothetical protein